MAKTAVIAPMVTASSTAAVSAMRASSRNDRSPSRQACPIIAASCVLQPGIHRFALERQHAERAFVDAAQRLAPHEALEPFDAERELAQRQRALARETAGAQPFQVLRQRVLRPVDD